MELRNFAAILIGFAGIACMVTALVMLGLPGFLIGLGLLFFTVADKWGG